MESREPIPIMMKKSNFKIPTIKKIPFIGLRGTGITIGVLLAITYTGLLTWSLLEPTKLAVIPALNLLWSILVIIGIVKRKPMLLLPALGSSVIAIATLLLFVVIDGFLFTILVTLEWKFAASQYLEGFIIAHTGDLDWKYALFGFYSNLCIAVLLIGLWLIVYSCLRSMQEGEIKKNLVELDIKFKSLPVIKISLSDISLGVVSSMLAAFLLCISIPILRTKKRYRALIARG